MAKKEPLIPETEMPKLVDCIMQAFSGQCAIQSSALTTEKLVERSVELGKAIYARLQQPE